MLLRFGNPVKRLRRGGPAESHVRTPGLWLFGGGSNSPNAALLEEFNTLLWTIPLRLRRNPRGSIEQELKEVGNFGERKRI
jgi:hypothetical protein